MHVDDQDVLHYIFRYELMLAVEKDKHVTVVHRNIKLVILFNPWCSGKLSRLVSCCAYSKQLMDVCFSSTPDFVPSVIILE